ncbi:MAG: 1-acyl-sn-glycerol-3-phosphate acyltransferase [Anaerolineales bacterium]|nr:1-acyl-sn-glycerol-3-phosphate acyltransferase [Anaerolineales bacterium]
MTVDSMSGKRIATARYNHARFERRRRFLRFLLKHVGLPLLAKMDHAEGLEDVPEQGAAILMINHIAFVDPIIVLHFVPRNIVPMAKIEVYEYPVVGILPKIWGVIPVRRQEVDRKAIQQAFDVLRAGEIVLVAPEATRSPQLRRGKEGVAYLASRTETPIIPVAIQGTQGFPALRYTAPWRGPGALVRFGKPFLYRSELRRADRDQLRVMTDEAMYVLAAMLPPEQRGVYADLSQATQNTLEWLV